SREDQGKRRKLIGCCTPLLNEGDTKETEALSSRLRDELAVSSTILARLRDSDVDFGPLDEISDVMIQLNKNLDLMWLPWSDGIAAAAQKRRATSETLAAYRQFGSIWRPRFADLNTKIVRLHGAMTSAGVRPEDQNAALDQVDQA